MNIFKNNFYIYYLNEFIIDISTFIVFKQFIKNFNKNIYKRLKKFVIFINFLIINYIIILIIFFLFRYFFILNINS